MREIHKDRKIDKYALEDELQVQPDLYGYWAEEHAEADAKRKEAEGEYKRVESALKEDVRLNYEKYGFAKPASDAAAGSLVISLSEYQKAYTEYLKWYRKKGMLEAAKEAMDQKRSSLKYLVELWTKDYYGKNVGGNVDGVEKQVGEKHKDEMQEKIEETVMRRRRK